LAQSLLLLSDSDFGTPHEAIITVVQGTFLKNEKEQRVPFVTYRCVCRNQSFLLAAGLTLLFANPQI
jgi:hypothetical protein